MQGMWIGQQQEGNHMGPDAGAEQQRRTGTEAGQRE